MSNDYNGKKRSELPDSVFGIPQERKYPMPDEKHTRSAIKLFNHVDPKYEEQLAKAVIKNMKKYGIDGSAVGPNNRLRKYLPEDMIKESYIEEGFLKSDKDIYYNKNKFDSGEINLCFITGLSGSGKSTMGRNMSSKNIEHYEMDDVICNDNFSDNNLKEYGGLISSFFKGAGKSFRLIQDDDKHNDSVFNTHKNYEKEITQAFVKHAISYCKSHKETKYVCDGIWIFMFIKPEQLKDCAVYIKGTSSIKSGYRALKRDIDEDKRNGMTSLQIFKHEFKRVKEDILYARENQKELKSFRSYFEKQLTNESYLVEESSNNKVYHLSQTNLDGKTIQPTVPSNYMTKNGYEDGKTKRVCFATSIDGCLRGLSLKCEGMKLFVHVPDGNYNIYKPSNKEVPDASITGEVWIKKAVKMKCIGQIHVIGDKGEDGIPYKYGDKTAELYDWEWKWIDKFNESYLLQEASIPEEIPNDIRELLKRLNSYDYGYIKNGQKIKGTKNFFEDYKSLTISEFEKYQIGVCWDYVHYEAYWFAKNHYKYETFYIQVQDEDNDCPSHTYLVFYLPNSSKVYYFESSWGKYQGIEEFDNINKLHDTIKERHIESARSKCDPKTYFRNKYDAKSSRWEHLSCGDFMVKVSNGKVQVNESSPILPQDTGISTVIFDIGDVLVSANIKDYLMADPEVPNEIVDELLKLWFIEKDEVDDTMDLDTYREIVNKRMGTEFSKYIPKLFRYNVECVTAFDYTIPMIQDLKDKGYKVYYLSNWSAWTHDLLQEAGKFDFLKLMDGGVFSYDVGYMKPNEEIYKILLNKYKINPEEAIFFDDREENIEAANKLGIHGIHFPRHDSSIVYNNLYGRKLAKAIYEDMDNLRYDFGPGRELEATYKLFLETNSMAINLQYEASKELMKIIKPVILEDKEFKNRAKELHLTLKCKLLPVKGSIISVLVLDGSQEYRDTPDARKLLNDIRASCIMIINKLSGLLKKYISKIDIGDGDEGCLYFHLNKIKAIVHDLKNKVVKEEEMDFPNIPIIFEDLSSDTPQINIQESIQEYGTTGGTIVGANQPDSVYIVNYMQNNVFSGYKEPKQAICKKGMNQMYTTKNGKAIPVDIDKFKEEASDVSVFRFKETPVLSFDKIIENASVDGDFYMLLTGDYPTNQHEIEYDNRFVQEENFLDELDDITCCTESTITGQIETSNYPYMKVLTESVQGRCWNYYRDINGVFAMNELTGLRTPSYENAIDIPRSQIKLIERGTVYLGE